MALICDRCGKGKLGGNLVSHSGRRTKRKFRPNLHTYWMKVDGVFVKSKFCTKCLRIVKKEVPQAVKVASVHNATHRAAGGPIPQV